MFSTTLDPNLRTIRCLIRDFTELRVSSSSMLPRFNVTDDNS